MTPRPGLRGVLAALARDAPLSGGLASGDEPPLLRALARAVSHPPARDGRPAPEPAGYRLRLPRLDLRGPLAARTAGHERLVRKGDIDGWRFVLRESGPQRADLMVERNDRVLLPKVLPVRTAGPVESRDYLMPLIRDPDGRITARLFLAGVMDWVEVSLGQPRDVTELDGGDPAVLAALTLSVAAAPPRWKEEWQRIAQARPADDPIRTAIEAAR